MTARRAEDRGAVLVIVMLLMLTVLGLALTAYWLTSGNLQVAANMNLRAQALYAAESGLERARAVLDNPATDVGPALLAGRTPGGDDVPTGVDSNGNANGVGALLVDGTTTLWDVPFPPATFGRGAGTANAPTVASQGRYTVWVRNDTAELRLGDITTNRNQVVVVRSRGVAADGRTQVILEETLVPPIGNPNGVTTFTPNGCHSGKNACDDNSSMVTGVVVSGTP
jgi:hypothetical protein